MKFAKVKILKSFKNLGLHPLCDDLIKVGSKQNSKLYKIEILFVKNALQLTKNIK